FAHLIERKNVKGGTNVIGIPEVRGKQPDEVDEKDLHEVFEISKPLESYGVDDSAVSHYVGPEDGAAVRSVILIDYQLTVVADMVEKAKEPAGNFQQLPAASFL